MGKAKQIVRSTDKETKVRLQERLQPDPMERICPLCLETSGALIGSYEQTALTTTPFIDHDGVQREDFLWKSAPNIKLTESGKDLLKESGWEAITEDHVMGGSSSRGHSLAFYKGLQHLKNEGDVEWEEDAYYYTHEEGVQALEVALKYITTEDPDNPGMPLPHVLLDGSVMYLKANKRSWENRFAEKAGVTFEELQERFPELYGKAPKKISDEEVKEDLEALDNRLGDGMNARRSKMHETDIPQENLKEMGLEDPVEQTETALDELDGPDPATLKNMEREPETEEEAIEVTAVTAAEADLDIKELIDSDITDDQADDHNVVVLRLTNYEKPERMSEDSFVRHIGSEDVHYYEVQLPELEYPIWVTPQESLTIAGTTYRFMEEDAE